MKKFLNYHHIIRYGLGLIFIANALVAFFAPAEFVEIIRNSFVASIALAIDDKYLIKNI